MFKLSMGKFLAEFFGENPLVIGIKLLLQGLVTPVSPIAGTFTFTHFLILGSMTIGWFSIVKSGFITPFL